METKDYDSDGTLDVNANEFLTSSKIPIKPHNFKLEVLFKTFKKLIKITKY